VSDILSKFGEHDVVIGDRNNHTFKQRKTMLEEIKKKLPGSRVVLIAMKVCLFLSSIPSLPTHTSLFW